MQFVIFANACSTSDPRCKAKNPKSASKSDVTGCEVCQDKDLKSAPKPDGTSCEICSMTDPRSAPKSDGTGCEICQDMGRNFAPNSDGSACEDCGIDGPNKEGTKCNSCSDGYYNFPACTGKWCKSMYMSQIFQYIYIYSFVACVCETQGTIGNSILCDENGRCNCKSNVEGDKCDTCSAGYYNFPACTGR